MEPKEIKDDLERFENLIKMTNFDYERYFMGILKSPPVVYEREINKLVGKYNLNPINDSILRFRFNNLTARFILFREKWNKKMMEREGVKKHFISQKPIIDFNNDNNVTKSSSTEITSSNESAATNYEKELDKLSENFNKSKIRAMIEMKITELKSKGYNEIDVSIEIVDGKPKLKIRPVK